MEDVFWEAPYNSSYQDEYFLIKSSGIAADFFTKQEAVFNNNLRLVKDSKVKSGLLAKNILSDSNIASRGIYSLPIFSEEAIIDPKQTALKDFSSFRETLLIDGLDLLVTLELLPFVTLCLPNSF